MRGETILCQSNDQLIVIITLKKIQRVTQIFQSNSSTISFDRDRQIAHRQSWGMQFAGRRRKAYCASE